ncbi:MAG: DUF3536 domain-containing protein, partial [Desulfonatronovibrio sp.]
MSPRLCIHGHFYQPPRFDPWLGEVLPEASAAPFSNWNERITRESYLPLAYARRKDSQGNIFNIINCYEHISFNFGPTVLGWMEKHSPDTYQRILEGDRKSARRLGSGNAMAQIYHHVIMPLSTDHDRDIEINWSVLDFQHRYGRRPEGMWLPETAVCNDTLEALARAGIKFTVLAPRQAEAVRALGNEKWHQVDDQNLAKDRAYQVRLPSGREVAVFFYDGPLSQAVAFERLLADGSIFWNRLLAGKSSGLLNLATDGESYGHHFKFGEMALAYVLEQALEEGSPLKLTNYASFLKDNPPKDEVRIRENTSWSCIHGIERWRDDCGCTDGGHPGWRQTWRRPLRRALNLLKYYIEHHYRVKARDYFKNGHQALLDYGRCLCGGLDMDEFLALHQEGKLEPSEKIQAMKLLEMQRMGLASFASCAWFFDDISRIEPLNSLSYALKGMETLRELGGPDVEAEFLDLLEEAYSNEPQAGDGRKIWADLVLPRKIEPGHMAAVSLGLEKVNTPVSFPGLEFELKKQGDELCLDYTWARTKEKGRQAFHVSERASFQGVVQAGGEDKTLYCPDTLDKRLKDYILFQQDIKFENFLWQDILDRAAIVLDKLTRPFEDGQKSPQAGLGILSFGVIYNYLESEKICADFERFWKDILESNAYFRDMLARKVARQLDVLTDGSDPDWHRAASVVSKAHAAGVYPDLFRVQNRLWLLGLESVPAEVYAVFF